MKVSVAQQIGCRLPVSEVASPVFMVENSRSRHAKVRRERRSESSEGVVWVIEREADAVQQTVDLCQWRNDCAVEFVIAVIPGIRRGAGFLD